MSFSGMLLCGFTEAAPVKLLRDEVEHIWGFLSADIVLNETELKLFAFFSLPFWDGIENRLTV